VEWYIDKIDRDLQGSAAKHQFGVIAVHNLQEMMKKKGVDLAIECRIYEVCNNLTPLPPLNPAPLRTAR
jgi:hypothetical protein